MKEKYIFLLLSISLLLSCTAQVSPVNTTDNPLNKPVSSQPLVQPSASPKTVPPQPTPTPGGAQTPPTTAPTTSVPSSTPTPVVDADPRWTKVPIASTPLTDFYFTDSQNGWVVGEKGLIRKTSDGGMKWETLDRGSKRYSSVYFLDQNTGWISADDGSIIKTSDSGKTWEPQNTTISSGISSVRFVNAQTGFFLAGNSTFKSTDGGATWTEMSSTAAYADRLDLRSETQAFAFGSSTFFYLNGGSWKKTFEAQGNYSGMAFRNAQNGWLYGPFETLYVTSNGGQTWKTQDSLKTPDGSLKETGIEAMTFANDQEGMFVNYPNAYTTTDGGQTWVKAKASMLSLSPGNRVFVKKLQLLGDSKTGWAMTDSAGMLRWSR